MSNSLLKKLLLGRVDLIDNIYLMSFRITHCDKNIYKKCKQMYLSLNIKVEYQ